jgi:predicted SnoaL-like aldol condensation-catalyzing enzyme
MTDVATVATDTAAERNRRLVETFQQEVLHRGEYEQASEWAHDDLVIHLPPGIPRGLDSALEWFALCAEWFTSTGIDIQFSVANEDTVFQLIKLNFVHTGDYMGVPPTNKPFSIDGLAAFRIREGKIAEHWGMYDMESIPAQLGLEAPSWPGA